MHTVNQVESIFHTMPSPVSVQDPSSSTLTDKTLFSTSFEQDNLLSCLTSSITRMSAFTPALQGGETSFIWVIAWHESLIRHSAEPTLCREDRCWTTGLHTYRSGSCISIVCTISGGELSLPAGKWMGGFASRFQVEVCVEFHQKGRAVARMCVCVTDGTRQRSDEYFTTSRERSIQFHSLAIDTRSPQISQIRVPSKQGSPLSEALDLINLKRAPGMRSCVSSD